jgi:hypothetical protein
MIVYSRSAPERATNPLCARLRVVCNQNLYNHDALEWPSRLWGWDQVKCVAGRSPYRESVPHYRGKWMLF